jgi:hypothetical protein
METEPRTRDETDESASGAPALESPEARLDAFREHPEWDDRRREAELRRLVERHPPETLRAAVRGRLHDLGGGDGEPVLRLVEALATPELLAGLAEALLDQPGLAPERAWEALALLDDAGMLARYPELTERWDELHETIEDEDGSIEQLAAQIEDDPEGPWLALQGLAAVEPDVRAEIVAGLAPLALGPNLVEFLRLLTYAHDPATRAAALEALASASAAPGRVTTPVAAAWAAIAADHPDPAVVGRARQWLGRLDRGLAASSKALVRPSPRPLHSLVTAIDGDGRGTVVLSARDGTTRASAAFLCDVRRGVREVFGQAAAEESAADAFLDEFDAPSDREIVRDSQELALGLLQGCLLLCGPETTPALRYWIEATLGPGVVPRPFPIPFPDWDPATILPEEMAERARLVLASCPSWVDTSDLTHDLAEEILLREGDSSPDPRRDAGAYRYLFEHRLRDQLELYRRMLLWMASFWQASGDHERGRSALALASQLSDEQHIVPGHPFTVALSSRSLAAAQANLRAGIDPRRRGRAPGS